MFLQSAVLNLFNIYMSFSKRILDHLWLFLFYREPPVVYRIALWWCCFFNISGSYSYHMAQKTTVSVLMCIIIHVDNIF